ncbi:hypothetical protein [Paenibacillus dendritiformis]|uniref:hypothetical protein n=1 Tax=Paenibacillus dendritiformis TaxID=130049 RepID=UPI00387E202C
MNKISRRRNLLEELKSKKNSENHNDRMAKMEEFIKLMKLHGDTYYPNAPSRWDDENKNNYKGE